LAFKRLPKVPLPAMLTTALSLPGLVQAAGLRFVPLPAGAALMAYAVAMPFTSGATELRLAARMMTSGIPDAVRALEAELDREPADVIVADFAMLAASLVAERRSVPLVAFFHSGLPFPHRGEHPWVDGAAFSAAIDERVADSRARLGLAPIAPGFFDAPSSPDLNLLATTPALEGRDADFGPTTHWVGPCVDGRLEANVDQFPFHRLRADAVKVYLSLGTVFNRHPQRFRTLLEGVTRPGVQVVVSAGPSFAALKPLASPDVLLFKSVPQLAVLNAVDFVVSHGGNNTVNETLLAGRPLLVLPIGGEQEANARRVERLGAGIALDRLRLSPSVTRSAFERLTGEPGYRERAAAIAESSRGLRGAEDAARRILELARRSRRS